LKSAEEIIEKLKNSFNAPSRKDEKVKAVVVCILISTTFWFFSALNKDDYTTQIDYPLEFVFDETQFMPVVELDDKIRIEVTGGGWDLMTRLFGFGMQPAQVNLADPSSSKYRLTSTLRGELSAKMIDINLNFILRDTLFYNIQRRITRSIPIVFDSISILLEEGFEITSKIGIDPPFIELVGPEDLVNAVSSPFIVYPDDSPFDEDVDEQFEIPSMESSLISTSVNDVRASFSVTEFFEFDEMLVVTLINNEDSLVTIEPSSVRVFYKKSEDDLEAVSDTVEIVLFADLLKINPTDSTLNIQIGVQASFIKDLRIGTNQVKVRYE